MAEPLAQPTSPLAAGAAPDPGALPSETFDAELSPQANEWLRQQLRAGTIKRENLPVSGQVGKAERAVGKAVIAATDEPFHQAGNWLSQYQGGFAPADAGVAPLVDVAQSLPLTGAGKAVGAAALKAGAHYLPAIFAGPGAKTANMAALKIAEVMEQRGEAREAILKATGWFRDANDKWWFEISDKAMSLGKRLPEGTAPVEQAVTHKQLFEAYPQLQGMPLEKVHAPLDKTRGGTTEEGLILNIGYPASEQRSTMLHELQHGVQDIEGAAPGGSPRSSAVKQLAKGEGARGEFDVYRRLAGEVQSRNVQARRAMSAAEREKTPPWKTEDVPPSQQIFLAPDRPDPSQPRLPSLQMDRGPLGPGAALPKSATELAPGLKIGEALEQSKGKPGLISQRIPTGVGPGVEDPHKGKPLIVGLDAMRRDPELFQTAVSLLRDNGAPTGMVVSRLPDGSTLARLKYPLPHGLLTGDIEADAQRYMQHVKDNLLFLYDNVPPEIRERSRLWYVGANRMAAERAKHYGLPDSSVAGIFAALSPQKDWFMNVSLGDRVLHTYMNHLNQPFTSDMAATAARIYGKPQYQTNMQRVSRARLRDLDDPVEKGMWLRIFDETYNIDREMGLRSHRVITPEGDYAGVRLRADGQPMATAWQTNPAIAKAVVALESGGDRQVLSEAMGKAHKVRNFYNNIYDPWSPWGDVTIDTHAIGAGLLLPVGGGDVPVMHSLHTNPTGGWGQAGTRSAPGSAPHGIKGTYGLYADAYRAAAVERGILPREMQSITWEAIRGLFPGDEKDAALKQAAAQLWMSGLSPVQIRAKLTELGGGIRPPDWHGR